MNIDFGIIEYIPFILDGLKISILLAVLTACASIAIGLALAVARMSQIRWLRIATTFYIDTMRSIPELVVLVWLFFSFPILTGQSLAPFGVALLALALQTSAYSAEIFRAGLLSVRPAQTQAGLALGMTSAQIFRKILLPQATIRMLPNFGSFLSMIIKDTAIASAVAVPEMMRNAEVVAGQTYSSVEVYSIAMIFFFLVIFPTTRGVDFIYRRLAHLGRS